MSSQCFQCGGRDLRPLYAVESSFDGAEFRPSRCAECGLVGLIPRLPLGELLRYYEGLEVREGLEDKIRQRFRPRVRWVSRRLPGRGRLLDVGCGGGQFPHAMKEDGWEVEGVEADEAKASRGAAEFEIRIHNHPFDQWEPPEDARYQAVTGWHVLEHFIDPGVALRQVARVLDPEGGRLFLEVPNFHSLGRVWGGPRWVHYDVPYHQHFFTPATLGALLEREGFEVLEVSRMPLDSDWWSLKRTLQRRLEGSWLRPLLRPLVSFMPIARLLVFLGGLAGYSETFQVMAGRRT